MRAPRPPQQRHRQRQTDRRGDIDQRPAPRHPGSHHGGTRLPGNRGNALHHDQQADGKADLAPQAKPAEAAQQQGGKADQRHGDRQQGLGQTAVRLKPQGGRGGLRLGQNRGVGPQQIARHQFGDAAAMADRPGQHRPQIIGEIGEPGDRDALAGGVQRLGHAVEHDQLRPRIAPHEQGLAGGECGAFTRLAGIAQEQAAQLAGGVDLVDVEGDALAGMGELAIGQKARGDVFRQGGALGNHRAAAERHQHMDQRRHHQRHHHPEQRHRPRHAKGRKAGRLHDHQFAFHRQLVGDIDCGDKARDRQHQLDHVGQRQQGEFDEHHGGLAIAHQLVKQHHGAVDPVDPHQNKGEKAEVHKQLRQKISVESWHWPGVPHESWPDASRISGRGKLISGHSPPRGLALADHSATTGARR